MASVCEVKRQSWNGFLELLCPPSCPETILFSRGQGTYLRSHGKEPWLLIPCAWGPSSLQAFLETGE